MKTLDEVIELLEQSQADDQMISIFEDDLADTIHYLKNYRDTKAWLDIEKQNYAEAVKNCERSEAKYTQMILNMNRNDPLTWQELQTMEGKPVWVEFLNYDLWTDPEHHTDGSWWVVGEVRKDDIIIAQYLDEAELCEEDLGEVWQAYREERDS